MTPPSALTSAAAYEIVIQGQLDPIWADWFDGLTMEACEGGLTRLKGTLPDQSALRAVVERIFDLNVLLVSIQRIY